MEKILVARHIQLQGIMRKYIENMVENAVDPFIQTEAPAKICVFVEGIGSQILKHHVRHSCRVSVCGPHKERPIIVRKRGYSLKTVVDETGEALRKCLRRAYSRKIDRKRRRHKETKLAA